MVIVLVHEGFVFLSLHGSAHDFYEKIIWGNVCIVVFDCKEQRMENSIWFYIHHLISKEVSNREFNITLKI